jgi:hypothetical protein
MRVLVTGGGRLHRFSGLSSPRAGSQDSPRQHRQAYLRDHSSLAGLAGRRARQARRRSLITFARDRPGHNLRYAIDASKAHRELGWKLSKSFEEGIAQTVQWYLESRATLLEAIGWPRCWATASSSVTGYPRPSPGPLRTSRERSAVSEVV